MSGDPSLSPDDRLFADLLQRQNLCTPERIKECISILLRLIEAGVTPVPRLGEVLIHKGYLSPDQVAATLKAPETPPRRLAAQAWGAGSSPPPEAAEAARNPANRLGKYIKVSPLGAGGMGQVWKAWDGALGRWVALKFPHHSDPGQVARFRREALTAAALNHPNIAGIFDVGEADGTPYIAMQFVPGQTLCTYPRKDVRGLVALVRDAALALHHAHEQGFIHRDLKPANLMVESGDPPRIYVMDFGLARPMSVESSLSISGSVVGTPAYMPPEQAQGAGGELTPAADVYALGATLYELLADRPPFQERDIYALLRQVIEQEPTPLRRVRPGIDRDLETIVLKCMEKDRSRRYESARSFAEDLLRWLEGEAIQAHPPSMGYRIRKYVARRKAVALVTTGGLAAVVLSLSLLVPRWREQKMEAERQKAARQAEKQEAGSRELALRQISRFWTESRVVQEWVRQSFRKPGEIRAALEKTHREITEFMTGSAAFPHAHYVRARLRLDLDRWDEAEEDLRTALGLDGTFLPAWSLLGRVKMEQYFRACRIANLETDGSNDQQAPLLREARECLRKGAGPGTERSFETWGLQRTSADAVDGVILKALEECYLEGDQPKALARVRKEHEAAPSEVYASWICAWSSRGAEQLRWSEECVRIAPAWSQAYHLRGMAFQDLRNIDGALRDFTEALRLDPDHSHILISRALALEAKGEFDGALRDLARVLQLNPRMAVAYNNRGCLEGRRKDYAAAEKEFTRALESKHDFTGAYTNRARARSLLKNFPGSLEDYSRAIELEPERAESWYRRADVHLQMNDRKKSASDLDMAIQLDPRHHMAYGKRAYVRQLESDWRGAVEDCGRYLQYGPQEPEIYLIRAYAHYQLRKGDESIADLERAVALLPPQSPRHREALQQLERLKKARGR